jgi:5-hydroxyisourate hydrolase-like protein (transthyretin family)
MREMARLSVVVAVGILVACIASDASGETLTGSVTSNGVPLPGTNVTAYNAATNVFVASGAANAQGNYSITLPAGSYLLRTFNGGHYINQLYNAVGNLACVGSCNISAGSPVVVPSGGSASGINFALALGAWITGTITNELTQAPLANIRVEVTNNTGVFVDAVTTDVNGLFVTASGFPTGTYFVRTDDNNQGYINEVYPNVPCLTYSGTCSQVSATSVAVTSGVAKTGVDISLKPGGRVSGHVINATGGAPIAAQITVSNLAGQSFSFASTDATGTYTTGRGLPSGVYSITASSSIGFFSQTRTSISVIEGTTTPNIDFALVEGGRISGTVRDAVGNPLPNIDVQILTATGSTVSFGFTNASGFYVSSNGLQPGYYFVRTASLNNVGRTPGFIHELYPNVECAAGCTPTLGTPIAVNAGATTAGVDFTLEKGGRIGGLVTEAGTGTPIFNAPIAVLNAAGTVVATDQTDATGRFVTIAGLPVGPDYFLRTLSNSSQIGEIWPDVPCNGNVCPPRTGSPIQVVQGQIVTKDVQLVRGARFRGNVLDDLGTTVVTGASVSVLDALGSTLASGGVDPLGNYIIGPGFDPTKGPFYARTFNSVGYLNELYTNVPCHVGCRVTDGTQIVLIGTNTTNGIDFRLSLGGRVTGHITDESGTPVAGVSVQLFNPVANSSVTATTTASGDYAVIGLPDATYYAFTTNGLGFINESFPNIPCVPGCGITSLGTPIVISGASTVGGIDFALREGGRVSGSIVDDASGLPLTGVSVAVVDAAGSTVSTAQTDAAGNYLTGSGIPTGKYYVRVTGNSLGYLLELYDNIPCTGGCTLSTGTAINVIEGDTHEDIDFGLSKGGRISGRISEAGTQAPIQAVSVQILDASGRFVASAATDAGGNYITTAGLAPGTYYVRTSNGLGYLDEQWNDKPCITNCSIVGGTPVVVTGTDTATGIDFVLSRGGRITGVVTDATTGQPLGGITVQIFDDTGTLVTSGFTSSFGVYTSAAGLAVGKNYHARTFNNLGYLNELYAGSICSGSCLVTQGTKILVADVNSVATANFSLFAGGRIAGFVTDTQGTPLRNVGVQVFDSTGALWSTGTTNAVGGYVTTQGLAAGDYYIRTLNSIGLIDQLYRVPTSLDCLGTCLITAGTPTSVNLGQTSAGINFQLALGGRLQGNVSRGGNAGPIANVTISVRDGANNQVATGVTDGSGNYLTGTGLPTGSYYAVTQNAHRMLS